MMSQQQRCKYKSDPFPLAVGKLLLPCLTFFFYVQAGIMRPVFSGGKWGRAQDTIALEDLRGIDTKQTRWSPWELEEGYISAQSCTLTSAGSPGRTNRDVTVLRGRCWCPSTMVLNIRGGCWVIERLREFDHIQGHVFTFPLHLSGTGFCCRSGFKQTEVVNIRTRLCAPELVAGSASVWGPSAAQPGLPGGALDTPNSVTNKALWLPQLPGEYRSVPSSHFLAKQMILCGRWMWNRRRLCDPQTIRQRFVPVGTSPSVLATLVFRHIFIVVFLFLLSIL